MKIFIWKKAAASAALLSLFACGDDSSSGSKTDVFSTKDDLPECTEKNHRRHPLRGKRFCGLLLRRRRMDNRRRHERNGHFGRFLFVGKEPEQLLGGQQRSRHSFQFLGGGFPFEQLQRYRVQQFGGCFF